MRSREGPDVERAIERSVLQGLPQAVVSDLLADAFRLDVPAGGIINRVDDPPWCGLVVGGVLRCYLARADGRQVSSLHARPGYIEGVQTILAPRHPAWQVRLGASAPLEVRVEAMVGSTVLVLSPERVRRLAETHLSVVCALAEQLAWTLEEVTRALEVTAFGTVRQRVAWRLLDLASDEPESRFKTLPVTQESLANAVGSRREVVARSLRELRRACLIATGDDGRIRLRDPTRLAAEAAGLPWRPPEPR